MEISITYDNFGGIRLIILCWRRTRRFMITFSHCSIYALSFYTSHQISSLFFLYTPFNCHQYGFRSNRWTYFFLSWGVLKLKLLSQSQSSLLNKGR